MHPELEDFLLARLGPAPVKDGKPQSRFAQLVGKHGTMEEFKAAVRRAVGEISVDEAEAAITSYRNDLLSAMLFDELAKQDVPDPWNPMSTVPRDGTEVILIVEKRAGIPFQKLVGHWMPGGHCIDDHPPIAEGWYFWNGCMFDKASKPLAWMSIPEYKPSEKKDGEGHAA